MAGIAVRNKSLAGIAVRNKPIVMKKMVLFLLCCLLYRAQIMIPEARAGFYKIGPGDVLNILVWKTPDLTRQVTVLPDGKIHLPLVGEVEAAGLTVALLEERLKSGLAPFVTDPVLFVSVVQVNSLVFYVTGKVYNPGRFLVQNRVNVLQALALAGGLNPFAKDKKIRIFRQADKGRTEFRFNYHAVSRGEDLDQNIQLAPGDVILVP